MTNVKINLNFGWKKIKNIYIKGTILENNHILKPEEVFNKLSELEESKVIDCLRHLNGYYSIINVNENNGWMAVDRIRSFPLFYGRQKDSLIISDVASLVKEQVGDLDIHPIARQEFLLTGFVTGPDTLFENVKQMQAGEVIFFSIDEGYVNLKSTRYYDYFHTRYYDTDNEYLLQQLDVVMSNIFDRLITIANGRTIFVPLSGGYDSRFIVLMLKRLGYGNICAFSYGIPNNEESLISKFIANKLNIRWRFVEYTNELWRQWYNTDTMRHYFKMAGNFCSLPHLQDWPAVLQLKNDIDSDAIFVPGISADLNTGGFVEKYPSIYEANATEDDLIKLILNYSYELYPFSNIPLDIKHVIEQKILRIIDNKPYGGTYGEKFECWVSTEKVAKFVLNSVRVYEFFGFDWWTPYWDDEFVSFWYNVPHQLRYGQKLYTAYLTKITQELNLLGDIDPLFRDGRLPQKLRAQLTNGSSRRVNLMKVIRPAAKRILPDMAKKYLRKKANLYGFKKHPLQWYGIHNDKYIRELIKKGAININSIIVLDYLDYLSN
jgi:asparagine synthase (glutamine-hydrolysing)